MKAGKLGVLIGILFLIASCNQEGDPVTESAMAKKPTATTRAANLKVAESLPLDDQQDFIEAKKGLMATDSKLVVKMADGRVIWDQPAYEFMQGKAPDSVNPSLWRQGRLNNIHGLFRVTEGIYQLRGFDLANMTLIEGKTGWIVIDPLTSRETAARAFEFAMKNLGEKPITGLLYTHSHVDHFGGVTGILTPEKAAADKVRIIAPRGFMEESLSENLVAGIVMGRRSLYMYGRLLPRSPTGHIGSGLGKAPAYGSISILAPTEIVDRTLQEKVIDGVRFVFQHVPGSEAPAEFTFYLPEYKAFCGAEIVSRHLHNIYTLRGAKVRDALKWSNYIDEAIDLFGETDIYFASHHWPIWGKKSVMAFLKKQRDSYKFIHDQTIRLANQGLTPREISEEIAFPESLRTSFSNRGYYGSLSHNSKAVYQHYFGWYDGNPANLHPLPPESSAAKYIEYMGGAEKVMVRARESFDKGEYRWVAEVLNHVVFADPGNKTARELLAVTYEQLGFQAESAPWRDVYLTGALELRTGKTRSGVDLRAAVELLRQTPISNFLDSMATRLNGPKAEGMRVKVNLIFTDLNESYLLDLENSVLHHHKTRPDPQANATIKLTRELYLNLAIGKIGVTDLIRSDDVEFKGSKLDLIRFFALFEQPTGAFSIVLP